MIYLVGAIFAIFFEFLLISKKDKCLCDKILAFWMFLMALHLFTYYTLYKGISMEYPILFAIGGPMPFVHGPTLFLYTRAVTGQMKRWKSFQFLHFLPIALYFLLYHNFLFLPREGKLEFIRQLMDGKIPDYVRFIYPIMVAHAITYLTLTFILLRKHNDRLKESYSYSDHRIDLLWLRSLLIGLTIVWTIVITANATMSGFEADKAIYATVVLFVFFIGFFGVRQGNIFSSPSPPTSTSPVAQEEVNVNEQKRYSRSGLKEDEASAISQQLTRLMETEKLYLEERLTLPAVAERLDIHTNYLSQIINERFRKNFYDFINTYRVEEFKSHISRGAHRKMTLFSLALECGFTSKGAFNSAFKKSTGQTPTEFIQSAKMNKQL